MEDDALVRLYLELPPGLHSSPFFMKRFKVPIQTELKLFVSINAQPLLNCTLYRILHQLN